jgi:hypothetical protein
MKAVRRFRLAAPVSKQSKCLVHFMERPYGSGRSGRNQCTCAKFDTNYLQYVGGIYSSEWFWAKLLRILRVDEEVRNACYSWVEHCDWIPFCLQAENRHVR